VIFLVFGFCFLIFDETIFYKAQTAQKNKPRKKTNLTKSKPREEQILQRANRAKSKPHKQQTLTHFQS